MKEPSNYTTADRSNAITLGEFMVCIGMGKHLMRKKGGGVVSKTIKKAAPKKVAAKPKGKIGKSVKRK